MTSIFVICLHHNSHLLIDPLKRFVESVLGLHNPVSSGCVGDDSESKMAATMELVVFSVFLCLALLVSAESRGDECREIVSEKVMVCQKKYEKYRNKVYKEPRRDGETDHQLHCRILKYFLQCCEKIKEKLDSCPKSYRQQIDGYSATTAEHMRCPWKGSDKGQRHRSPDGRGRGQETHSTRNSSSQLRLRNGLLGLLTVARLLSIIFISFKFF